MVSGSARRKSVDLGAGRYSDQDFVSVGGGHDKDDVLEAAPRGFSRERWQRIWLAYELRR